MVYNICTSPSELPASSAQNVVARCVDVFTGAGSCLTLWSDKSFVAFFKSECGDERAAERACSRL